MVKNPELHSSDLEKYIILRSEDDLRNIFSTSTTREVAVDGNYLAEMCIGWPAGLRIVLKAGYRLQRSKLLSQALRSNCFESVQLLLTGDDPIIDTSHVYAAYGTGNSRMFKMVVHALAERRRNLQKLAERHLPVHIQGQLDLPKQGVLDSHAWQVYLKLKQFGIDYDPGLWGQCDEMESVYGYIEYDVNAAKTLFDAGFQNFEGEAQYSKENKGLTMLMHLARMSYWRAQDPGSLKKVLETLQFLVGKVADPHRRRHEDGRTVLHFLGLGASSIFWSCVQDEVQPWNQYFFQWSEISPSRSLDAILRVLDREWSPLKHNSWSLLENLFMDSHNDACSCACSAQGCLPCTAFFRNLMEEFGFLPKLQAMAEVIRFLGERGGARSMEAWNDALAPIVIRICVFEYLELTHLCCAEVYPWPMPQYRRLRDDMELIRDEEQPLIEEVENLTAFFSSKYHEMELGLPQFLLEYWLVEIRKNPKPDDEEKKLEYEMEIEQIRSIGVILDESCT